MPSTWFGDTAGGEPGINLNLNGHEFTFPQGFTEEQVETAIRDWIKQNHPDWDSEVDVKISGDGEERRVEVRIEHKDVKTDGAPSH